MGPGCHHPAADLGTCPAIPQGARSGLVQIFGRGIAFLCASPCCSVFQPGARRRQQAASAERQQAAHSGRRVISPPRSLNVPSAGHPPNGRRTLQPMLPADEFELLTTTAGKAIDLAAEGRLADGYAALRAGLTRALECQSAGEPHGAELVARWCWVCEWYSGRYGVPREKAMPPRMEAGRPAGPGCPS
jgi:hypothetical protein